MPLIAVLRRQRQEDLWVWGQPAWSTELVPGQPRLHRLCQKKKKRKREKKQQKRSFLRVMQLARMMGFERGKVGGKAHLLSITSMAPERVTTCLSPFAQDWGTLTLPFSFFPGFLWPPDSVHFPFLRMFSWTSKVFSLFPFEVPHIPSWPTVSF